MRYLLLRLALFCTLLIYFMRSDIIDFGFVAEFRKFEQKKGE